MYANFFAKSQPEKNKPGQFLNISLACVHDFNPVSTIAIVLRPSPPLLEIMLTFLGAAKIGHNYVIIMIVGGIYVNPLFLKRQL